ncbi:hypothetical protein E8E14_011398 [Neopestalotiopsis sp. 37M]|nr:hypothetical protein E8E14_011398 [Neopestalotiopsis sp. 37M]
MFSVATLLTTSALAAIVAADTLSGTSSIWLGNNTGGTNLMGSGILLGSPLNPNQIPDSYWSDIGFWNMRSGGSQLNESRGWTYGYDDFLGRYESLKADYEVAKRHGARFQIMIHDMWGTDFYPSIDATPMPGDNGSYEEFDNFLDTFFGLLVQDNIIDNVWWDLWNEVDNVDFLNRGLDRWLEYWGHAYHKITNEFPNGKTIGPSYGHLPNFAGDVTNWFTEWASFVNQNQSIPDKISLHFLYADGDLTTSLNTWNGFLADAGVQFAGEFVAQEYGHPDQQVPSGAAWNIAQLERHQVPGLRANWRGGDELHDYMANLLGKPGHYPNYDINDAGYYPAREYPVYLYYAQQMKAGYRVATSMSADTLSDTFAVVDPDTRTVRILAGCRPNTGVWFIDIAEVTSLGLPSSGQLPIKAIRFNSVESIYDPVTGSDDLGYTTYDYADDVVVLAVYQNDPDVAFAFEFSY